MTKKLTLYLNEPVQAHKAIEAAWRHAKPLVMAGHRLVLEVKPETRKMKQNAHYHAQIGDISKHVGGVLADPEDAKRILISAFKIETKDDPDLAGEWENWGDFRLGRGLHNEAVLLGTQSRDFSIKLGSAFIDWLYAFGAEHKVVFKTPIPKEWME